MQPPNTLECCRSPTHSYKPFRALCQFISTPHAMHNSQFVYRQTQNMQHLCSVPEALTSPDAVIVLKLPFDIILTVLPNIVSK